MSLYNILFGINPDADAILSALHLNKGAIERFRDCWIDEEESRIVIYTRTGGGNRDYFRNEALTSHPLYQYDEDDEFDSTYARYYFSMPDLKEENNG